MPSRSKNNHHQRQNICFVSTEAPRFQTMYFPLSGTDAGGLKSAVTPFLSGDIKIDSSRYLTKPASTQDLRTPVRNFFCLLEEKGEVISLARGTPSGTAQVEVGPLWHKLRRHDPKSGLTLEALNFIPVTADTLELMRVRVQNSSRRKMKITPTFSLPVFGRALANKHDHEHVTSLLQRIRQVPQGVIVEPTMLFNERGHTVNKNVYFVLGVGDAGENPVGTFPTIESFYGESGDALVPEAVVARFVPRRLSKDALEGKEACGALRFKTVTLAPGKAKEYFIVMGIASDVYGPRQALGRFNTAAKFEKALAKNKQFWQGKATAITFHTADEAFDTWMSWVNLQPVLRRIFGCSFLPDHDYGKGGKGWRDLWQDLLSLILIEPQHIRENLINNFAGVRIDGSNATIIGTHPGEFVADRNAITRVWMDHGAWPLLTLLLYIHQTGDCDILLEENTYYSDRQIFRARGYDTTWDPAFGSRLKDKTGSVYYGTVLEHILIQHLVAFFNVGEHNITRLEDADWNDGLDMAGERGESVAFMSFYAGNLIECAHLLEYLARSKKLKEIALAKELLVLLDSIGGNGIDYASVEEKQDLLYKKYFPAVQPRVSGEQVRVPVEQVVHDLLRKGVWIFEHIRRKEKVREGEFQWFNGYYDNKGKRVEGKKNGTVRMTLTGQVFPIMSGLADEEDVGKVVRSVRRYLKDKKLQGYRLNTDFGVSSYMDLGRAFGFAYGTKENGAFFNHMNVMYAYALYTRGFAKEGYEVIESIYRMCMQTQKSRIYPGIPEYFDGEGRGHYHYLTGSASWLVLTVLTQMFGVRGQNGDLVLCPKLVKEQFDKEGKAGLACQFAGTQLSVTYINKSRRDFGQYAIKKVELNGKAIDYNGLADNQIKISRNVLSEKPTATLNVFLG